MRRRIKYLLFFVTPVALAAPLAVPLQMRPPLGGPGGLPIETLGSSPGFVPGDCALGPSGEILGVDGCAGPHRAFVGAIDFPPVGDDASDGGPLSLLSGTPGEMDLPEGLENAPTVELVEEAFWDNAENNGFGMIGPISLTSGGNGGSLYFSNGKTTPPPGTGNRNRGPGFVPGAPNGFGGVPSGNGGSGGGNGGGTEFAGIPPGPGFIPPPGGGAGGDPPGGNGPSGGTGGNGPGGGDPETPREGGPSTPKPPETSPPPPSPEFVEIPGRGPLPGGRNENFAGDPKPGGGNPGEDGDPSDAPRPREPESGPQAVPEPHGLLVIAAALAAFGFLWRRSARRLPSAAIVRR
jgi:hypothetical protein